jgi:hypothetical protein
MPEKYQKNRKSQHSPAQSKPFGVVAVRLKIAIKGSSTLTNRIAGHGGPHQRIFPGVRAAFKKG